LRSLLQRDQGGQRIVGVDLLLDAGELDQLLSKLVGVERAQRILILQLSRQQLQEALKVPAICWFASALVAEAVLELLDDEVCGVVPETTVMSFSSNSLPL